MKNHRTVRYNIQIFCKRRNDSLELYLLGFQIWVYVDSIIQTVISLWFLYESWWYFLHLHQSWKLSLLNWSKFTIGQAETLQCIYCLWCQVTDLILTANTLTFPVLLILYFMIVVVLSEASQKFLFVFCLTVQQDVSSLCYKRCVSQTGVPVSWYRAVQDVPLQDGNCFFVAHEFFDALPVHQFQVLALIFWCWQDCLM